MESEAIPKLDFRIEPCRDASRLLKLVNDAYEVETGSTGVSFKKAPRFDDVAELALRLEASECLAAVTSDGRILGAIVFEIGDGRCFFGPFAVDRTVQGAGVGRALLAAVEAQARNAGCTTLEMSVINHRTDLIPMYQRWGFKVTGVEEYTETHKLTRPSHFVNFARTL